MLSCLTMCGFSTSLTVPEEFVHMAGGSVSTLAALKKVFFLGGGRQRKRKYKIYNELKELLKRDLVQSLYYTVSGICAKHDLQQ